MSESNAENNLYSLLNELTINYSSLEHPVITTMEEGADLMKLLEGVVPVNLLLKDKTGQLYMLIKKFDTKIPFGQIGKKLGVTGLTMAPKELMSEKLGVPMGSATVFAIMNDSENNIKIIIDENLKSYAKINFHPMINNKTITITFDDMIKFICHLNHGYQFI